MHIRWDKKWGIPAISGAASFVLGSGVGYIAASARFSKKIKDIEESQRILREHFEDRKEATNTNVSYQCDMEEEAMPRLQAPIKTDEAVVHYSGGVPQVEDSVPDPIEEELILNDDVEIRSTIFSDDDNDEWDYDIEVPKRGDVHPYIIHRDEFFAEESGYRQSSLTYYAGDNILCDEKDSPIYDHSAVAGTLRFGHGSKDPNIVYIRNPQLQAEYEIIFDSGYYQVEVLGAVIEGEMHNEDLKHSVYRFRKD